MCLFSQEKDAKVSVQKNQVVALLEESSQLFKKNRYKIAIRKAIKAVTYSHQLEDNKLLSESYRILSSHFSDLSDVKPAKKYLDRALLYAEESNSPEKLYKAYNSVGHFAVHNEKKPKKGIDYYNKALEIAKELKDTLGIINITTNLGWTYLDMEENDRALPYLKLSRSLNKIYNKELNDITCDLNYLIGRNYLAQGEYSLAEDYLTKALDCAKKINNFIIIVDVLEVRSQLYEKADMLNQSIDDLKLRHAYKDSIYQAKELDALETAKAKFKLEQYKKELTLAQKENHFSQIEAKETERKLLIAVLFSVLSIGLILLYFNNKTRKKANEVLQEKNRLLTVAKQKSDELNEQKSQFIATITHELRTPLYGVIGIANLLSEDRSLGYDKLQLIASLKKSGDFLLKHINDVLKIGEIESKKEEVNLESVNLRYLTEKIEYKYKDIASKSNNNIHVIVNKSVPELVVTDKLRITEVLDNLVNNACKFTENGNIWLRINNCEDTAGRHNLCFEVEDDGIGISEDKKEAIFDKFYQANRGQKDLDGTGLGLSVVKYLLSTLGSKIDVDSSEGKGAKFYFELNVGASNLKTMPTEEVEPKKRRILVAEDNKISQTITKKMVESLGHICVACDDGLETLKAAKESDYDLILMDINMPVMDGIESAKNILEHKNTIPIVALTALDLNEIKTKCFSVGMLYAVNKPVGKESLKEIIDKYSLKQTA